jgi:hypothetical protein
MKPALLLLACLAMMAAPLRAPGAEKPMREFSFDLWDWTPPCRDLNLFRQWVADLKSIGVTRIEISAPWNLLEPEPGRIDLSFIADRLAIVKEQGLGLRIRINSFWSGATPAWYVGDMWCDIDGQAPKSAPRPPSIHDERFWSHFAPLCTAIARQFKGEDIYYNPFIGIHAELKWADWWSYDASSLAAWRKAIHADPRPAWLAAVAGDAPLPEKPPIPPQTHGRPDNSAQSKAWIAFREQAWRDAVRRFNEAIRTGDPDARTSAPLGESFRRGSAQMSNLDYWGLSRGMNQVVHSYDFYWHPKDDPWMAAAAVASFRGITGIDNIVFEFDGPDLIQRLGYDEAHQVRLAQAAMSQGAGLKAANYTYDPRLPSQWPVLKAFGKLIAEAPPAPAPPAVSETVLLFVSKWANYCYREPTEWLHDAQFGAWEMLRDSGHNVRFICEDNLDEPLAGYRGLYVAFSPPELIPQGDREKLAVLAASMPSIIELTSAPQAAPSTQPESKPPELVVKNRSITLNYPLAYQWLRGDRAANEKLLDEGIRATWGSAPHAQSKD